jgi:hypothetical protein
MDNVPYNDHIEFAIINLKSQIQSNFSATTRKHNIQRITFAKRFKSESISKQNTISYIFKILTNVEEDVLVRYINKLNIRRFPSIF